MEAKGLRNLFYIYIIQFISKSMEEMNKFQNKNIS